MNLNPTELAYVRSQGLYVTEKCDGGATLLNQSLRYTIPGRSEAYCSSLAETPFSSEIDAKRRSG